MQISNPEEDLSGLLYTVANFALSDFGIGQISRDQTAQGLENDHVLRCIG